MERLTKRTAFGTALPNSYEPTDKEEFENWMREYLKLFAEKLAAYEDAEQDGRLVMLPCKVGSTMYGITHSSKIATRIVKDITITKDQLYFTFGRTLSGWSGNIGKTLFLTREEAEEALRRRQEIN